MARVVYKDKLGAQFSEGARQLWLVMDKRGWNQSELADALKTTSAQVNRWLYGDRRPMRAWSRKIEEVLGIGPNLWDAEPRGLFVLPAVEQRARTTAA